MDQQRPLGQTGQQQQQSFESPIRLAASLTREFTGRAAVQAPCDAGKCLFSKRQDCGSRIDCRTVSEREQL
jgi:hypothetical protein